MNLYRVDESEFSLCLTPRELELFLACLRESFATLDQQEYSLRVGIPISEASAVALRLNELMEREGLAL